MSKFEEAMGKWFDAILRKKMIERRIDLEKKEIEPEKTRKPIIKYSDIEDEIFKKLEDLDIKFGEPVSVVHGFISPQFSTELNGDPILGGDTIPMITLVGDSGRLYFVAFKKLFPDKEI